MDILSNAISQMLVLFIITIVGYAATKLGILDDVSQKKLTALIFRISMPAMIIAGITQMQTHVSAQTLALGLGLGVLQFFLLFGCGELCATLMRIPRQERPAFVFMALFTNLNFIGLPVVVSLYGSDATIYATIVMLPMMLLANFVGLPMLMSEEDRKDKKKLLKGALNPPSIASLIGLAIFLLGIDLPGFADTTLTMLGQITPPTAMLIVGIILAGSPIKEVFTDLRIYPFILIRMVALPIATFLVLHLFIEDYLLLGAFTVLFAMPVGAMAPAFVAMYGRDSHFVAAATIVTTMASFAVIPLMMWVMSLV